MNLEQCAKGTRCVFSRFVLEALARPCDTPQSYLSCLTLIYGCVHTVSYQFYIPEQGHVLNSAQCFYHQRCVPKPLIF